MSAEPLMWFVEWTFPNPLGLGGKTTSREDFLRREDAQAFFDERNAEAQRMKPEHEAMVSLKRAPFAPRLEAWLKALRKNGIRSRKNVSYAAFSKMDENAPTIFHTGWQGSAYEAWGDEVYYKGSGDFVRILHFNHNNMSPAQYQTMRDLLEAYGLPYAWDGSDYHNLQIITPHGEIVYHACDFCEELAQGSTSEEVDGLRMCKACVEVNQ